MTQRDAEPQIHTIIMSLLSQDKEKGKHRSLPKRFIFDYVDLVKSRSSDKKPQGEGQTHLEEPRTFEEKQCPPDALESWKAQSSQLPHMVSHFQNLKSPPNLQQSTMPGSICNTTGGIYQLPESSLPPSSPILGSFREEGARSPEGDEEIVDLDKMDPFGFLAAERKLKTYKPRLGPVGLYSGPNLVQPCYSPAIGSSRKAVFATPIKKPSDRKAIKSVSRARRKRNHDAITSSSVSPSSFSVLKKDSMTPSLLCRKVVQRRSTRHKGSMGTKSTKPPERGNQHMNNDENEGPDLTVNLESLLPGHHTQNRQGQTKPARKRATNIPRQGRKRPKTDNSTVTVPIWTLSHLDDEHQKVSLFISSLNE